MSDELVLYDLPSQAPCRSWSGNVWKTRLALNFKGIPYRTEWVPYIRLEETLKSLGLKANPPGSWSDYSVPTVRLPDGSYVMDSAAIAVELEARHPTPSLRLDSELEQEAQAAMGPVFVSLVPYLLPLSPRIVAPEDVDWFKADRAKRFGMTIEEAFDTKRDPAEYFASAQPGLESCAKVLRDHKIDQGPFILGSEPCYADFCLDASMQMFTQIGGELIAEFWKAAPVELRELHEACEKWAVKQD